MWNYNTLSTSLLKYTLLIIAYNIAKTNSSSSSTSRVNLILTFSNEKKVEIETLEKVINKIKGVKKDNNNNNNE